MLNKSYSNNETKTTDNSNYYKSYTIIGKLGKGAYGTVYKIKLNSYKDIYAMKQINLSTVPENQIEYIKNEITILSSLNNEFIVKYITSFIEYKKDEYNRLNIIMEYCDGGDLSGFIEEYKKNNKYIEESKIIDLFSQICNGLDYLHSKKILHRDLKALNIFLFKDGRVKLGDFGVAKVLMLNSLASTFIGTPFYLSPEICEEKPYNEKTDIWSLGCILYEMLTLKKPFNSSTQVGLILKIIKGKYEPIPKLIDSKYKKELINILDRLLIKNTNNRFNACEIIEILIQINLNKVIEKKVLIVNLNKRPESALPVNNNITNNNSKRVRFNPKDKSKDNQLSRQALLAKQRIFNGLDKKLNNENSNIDYIDVKDRNKFDNIMKQLDDFDLQFDKKNDDYTENSENKLINDNLSATLFLKQALNTKDYDLIFKEEENIPVLFELSENINFPIDSDEKIESSITETRLEQNLKLLIGENIYNDIIGYYLNLVEEENELTDLHSKLLNDQINNLLKNYDKEIYLKFLQGFYKIIYIKYIKSLSNN